MARINCVKMNILPRFLYLFQCIPLFLSNSFFSQVDSLISEFLWNKKISRLSKGYLQRPKLFGGMALPNFRFYYWAANIRTLKYWLQPETTRSPDWLVMERNSAKPVSLAALLYSPIQSAIKKYSRNSIVKMSLKIVFQLRRHLGLQIYSHNAPLIANHGFIPSITDKAFLVWSSHGVNTFKDLYIDNIFASFQQLCEKYSIPKQHFFRYLQLRSFAHSHFPTFPNLPQETFLDVFAFFKVKRIHFFYL